MNRSVVGFLLFLISLIGSVGFVWPKAMAVRQLGVEERAKKEVIAVKKNRLTALTTLSQTFATNANRVKLLTSILPPLPQIPEVLVTVEAMARASGISIQSITPQDDDQGQRIIVTIVGDGELSAIEGFVDNVGLNSRPITVDSASIVKNPEGNRLSVVFGLSFPYHSQTSEGSNE